LFESGQLVPISRQAFPFLFGAGRTGCGDSPPDQAVARQNAQNFRQSLAVAARGRRETLSIK